jgi:hypothetical protein
MNGVSLQTVTTDENLLFLSFTVLLEDEGRYNK